MEVDNVNQYLVSATTKLRKRYNKFENNFTFDLIVHLGSRT
jgi:hypothetical protein